MPPARQMDFDEQVARLVQHKMAEMLPPPPFTSKRKRHDSDNELEWKDLSDQPGSSDDSEIEVFLAPKKHKNKKRADSSDTWVRRKAPLIEKTKKKKSKKSKKHRSSSSDSSSDSTTTSESDTLHEGKYTKA